MGILVKGGIINPHTSMKNYQMLFNLNKKSIRVLIKQKKKRRIFVAQLLSPRVIIISFFSLIFKKSLQMNNLNHKFYSFSQAMHSNKI